jgi:hypothetical protein
MFCDVGVARTANKNPPLESGGPEITAVMVDDDQCGLALSAHSAIMTRMIVPAGLVSERSLTELCPYFKR